MSRILSWFATKNGRRFTQCCVGAAALTVFGSQMAFHGPLLDNVIKVCQVYDHSKPRPFSSSVNVLIDEVLQDSNLKEEQKKKVRFFYVVGHELFHAGGINSPWGAIIGIPFTLQDIKDVDLGELKIRGKDTMDWIIEGRELMETLNITDKAKKFALMQEIYSCNLEDSLINATIAAGCVLLPARFAAYTNAKVNAFERFTIGKRCTRYFLFYIFGYIMYRCLKDPLKHLSEKKCDRLVAEISSDYLDGGIEYYKKMLQRNIVLGELLNTSIRKLYDKQGNEHYFLLVPKLPISKRLDLLRMIKEEKKVSTENQN